MRLSDSDFGLLQRNVDAIVDKIARLNLNIAIDRDFNKLSRFLKSKMEVMNPSYDPALSDPLRNNGFWFRITDQRDQLVGSFAQVIHRTDDMFKLVESGELWQRGGFAPDNTWRDTKLTPPSVRLSGMVAHAGALWMNPEERNQGLSYYLPYISRVTCLRNWEIDYWTAVVFKRIARTKFPYRYYGFTHVEPCIEGYFPPTGEFAELSLCWISKEEMMDRIRHAPDDVRYPIFDNPVKDALVFQAAGE